MMGVLMLLESTVLTARSAAACRRADSCRCGPPPHGENGLRNGRRRLGGCGDTLRGFRGAWDLRRRTGARRRRNILLEEYTFAEVACWETGLLSGFSEGAAAKEEREKDRSHQ